MFVGLALVIIGVSFFLEEFGLVSGSFWGYVWHSLLVVLGLSLILGRGLCGMRWRSHGYCAPGHEEKKQYPGDDSRYP